MKTLYLVRHGQSEANVDWHILREQEEATILLTPLGQEQAFEAGDKIGALLGKDRDKTRFFVSPWTRALMTYRSMVGRFGATDDLTTIMPSITEQHMNLVNHEENWAKFVQFRDSNWSITQVMDVGFEGGESMRDMIVRADKFVRYLQGFPDGPIVVVSHGLFIKMMIAIMDGIDPETITHPKNCEIITKKLSTSLNSYEQLNTFCTVKGYKIVADAEDYGLMKVTNPKKCKRVSVHISLDSTRQILETLGRLENE